MRLLWEEEGFELVGAFCVAAFSLVAAWMAVESLFELGGFAGGLLAVAAAVCMLETVSRRHYADRRPAPAPRTSVTRGAPPARRGTSRDAQPDRRAAVTGAGGGREARGGGPAGPATHAGAAAPERRSAPHRAA